MSKNKNRDKGCRLERKWTNIFKIWFSKCRTSRQASRLLDDSKVDIAFIPWNVQCKKGYTKGINYSKIFQEMKEELIKNFPESDPQINYPKIIVHDKGRKQEEKLVVIQEKDFLEILNKLYGSAN